MSDFHLPVLLTEVTDAFMKQPKAPLRILDGTFGRGGHSIELLKTFPTSEIVAFDKDQSAVEFAKETYKDLCGVRLNIIHDDFKNLDRHNLGIFDGALFDLGVSSPQFDVGARGFSFMHDGPLDMRMNKDDPLTAQEIINGYSEKDLSDLFFHVGEIRKPNRVVRAIIHDRVETPFKSTRQLASLIERVDGRSRGKTHPATSYFMALRLTVNGELEGLGDFLTGLPKNMEAGARLCVISFHSSEDRIVKNSFKLMNKKSGIIINKKVITASDGELERNPRARSAKLRIFQMGDPI